MNGFIELRKPGSCSTLSCARIPLLTVFLTMALALTLATPTTTALKAGEISVTVYNSDLGVVREVRDLEFKKGLGSLAFRDVPSRIDPTSVRFLSLDSPDAVQILEQNYQFDLISPAKLYARYLDKEIELISKDGKIYSGTLLTNSSGSVMLSDDRGQLQIVHLAEIASVNFPELPEGLITRPTLIWNYASRISGNSRCEVSYQTAGISWSAEYIALLNENEDGLDLSGWSSIDNRSGKTYREATLKLIAGDIHRAGYDKYAPVYRTAMIAEASMSAGFEEKAFFEYHLYTLPRPSTIADNEIKQLSLFEPASASVKKEYHYSAGSGSKKVTVKLILQNSKANGLGMPLPAGRVRVFKNDSDGSSILLGEDRIDHTPRDEKLTLTIGQAFDLVAEETVVERRSISKKVSEVDFLISLRNRKDSEVTILATKRLGGDWKILESSHEYEKKSADQILFAVKVPANSEIEVKYSVRYQRN